MLTRWDPFRDLSVLQDRINRIFNEHFGRVESEAPGKRSWAPPVDILETPTDLVVRAEIPGVKREDIDVEVTPESLTIRGERKFDEENKDQYLRVERPYGPFQRSFSIGVPVQADKVKATYKDGVLEITIPKAEEVTPKKVEIKAE
ncbi:MAG: Hsp20/alpha crystallin family protein [Armatimonadota bacterium]|nr:Hsp20/alpha crystallin family protein [Armatimonadota bacterium]